jgi:hypothetical protein
VERVAAMVQQLDLDLPMSDMFLRHLMYHRAMLCRFILAIPDLTEHPWSRTQVAELGVQELSRRPHIQFREPTQRTTRLVVEPVEMPEIVQMTALPAQEAVAELLQ